MEPIEIRLARLEEMIKGLAVGVGKIEATTEQVSERVETVDRKVDHIEFRLSQLETSVAAITPTVTEWKNLRAQADGATRFGKFLWGVGMIVAAVAGWVYHAVTQFIK